MFDIGRADQIRGVHYAAPVNCEAIDLVCQTTKGTPLEKRLFIPRFKKAIRKYGLESLTPWFRFHYVTARLYLQDFSDYWGWEYRGMMPDDPDTQWAARLFWEETWMPKWGGGNVNRLLVLGEQGVGDAIFHASIIPEALIRANEVIFETEERLHSMLRRSFPRLRCEVERHFEDRRTDYGEIDAFIPAADLMRMFRRHKSHFPAVKYLKPDPERAREFEGLRGKTALSWVGRQGRIDPAESGLNLNQCFSVQYNETHPEIPSPLDDPKNDLEGVLAALSVCERLVTVPTSAHHLAGASGVRTEIIDPTTPGQEQTQIKWDYPPGKLLWYPDAHVFTTVGEWRTAYDLHARP